MAAKLKPRLGITESVPQMKRFLTISKQEPEDEYTGMRRLSRPKTRADCVGGPRPCPWVSCRHHLYLDVSGETGSLNFPTPHLEPDQLRESCSLDVADRHELSLEEVGAIMGVSRERIRQIEARAIRKIQESRDSELEDFHLPDD